MVVVLSPSFYQLLTAAMPLPPPAAPPTLLVLQRHWYPVSLQNQMKVATLATTCFLHVQLQHVQRPGSHIPPAYSLYSALSAVHCHTPSCASVWLGRACECNVNDTQLGHSPPPRRLRVAAIYGRMANAEWPKLFTAHAYTSLRSHTHTHLHRHV